MDIRFGLRWALAWLGAVFASPGALGAAATPDAPASAAVGSTASDVSGASLQVPATAPAGSSFRVAWKGPNNEYDHVTIAPRGSADEDWEASEYVDKRGYRELTAPLTVGEYEVRYVRAQSHIVLARAELRVTPGTLEPGRVAVSVTPDALASGGAVEIILDASGGMLERLGAQRRIDAAQQTLTNLTTSVIPAGTPFALRVFGRAADACQTDLDRPLLPLDAAAVAAKLVAVEPRLNSKAPIGASIEKLAEDLGSARGERLVILVTNGGETCGGNPAQAIQKLKRNRINLRVNIVGFAIGDAKLASTLRLWSKAGNGEYFDARDAAGLSNALTLAVRPAFEIVDAQRRVVAAGLTDGEPVRVPPGAYSVRLRGQKGTPQPVVVRANETSDVSF